MAPNTTALGRQMDRTTGIITLRQWDEIEAELHDGIQHDLERAGAATTLDEARRHIEKAQRKLEVLRRGDASENRLHDRLWQRETARATALEQEA